MSPAHLAPCRVAFSPTRMSELRRCQVAVEHALRRLAGAIVHVDVGAQSILGHRDLEVGLLSNLAERMRIPDVVDRVLLVAEELLALLQHLACVGLQVDEQPKLLVPAAAGVLPCDPVNRLDAIERCSERRALRIGQPCIHERVRHAVERRLLGDREPVEAFFGRVLAAPATRCSP